ncbi:MAG: DUF1643 domain-containing protein [Magnetococcales bacterium]|nr:DUF1643 domain-containing protein [Magnetococcales bacterium]
MENPNRLRAADLKKKFAVFGHFYQFSSAGHALACRSLLELVAHHRVPGETSQLGAARPDLLVVMMNPGSSRPLNPDYRPPTVDRWHQVPDSREWVLTRPDNTQYQIMRLMAALGLEHGRVLNLSDLREPKSPVLFKKMADLEGVPHGEGHSVFSSPRGQELKNLLEYQSANKSVLVGWGRDRALLPLARLALDRFSGWTLYGQPVNGEGTLYSHPSPMLQRMKEAWLDQVLKQIG